MWFKAFYVIRNCSKVDSVNLQTLTMAASLCMIEYELLLEWKCVSPQLWWTVAEEWGKEEMWHWATRPPRDFTLIWFALIKQKKGNQPKTVFTEVAKATTIEVFQRSPKKSIWQYQQESGVSYGSMQWLLKEMNFCHAKTVKSEFNFYYHGFCSIFYGQMQHWWFC